MFFVQEVTLQEQNDFIYEKPLICADFMLKLKPWGKWRLGAEAAAGRWWVYAIGNLGRRLPNSLKINFSLEEESVQNEQLVPDCSIIFWFSFLISLTNAKDVTASGFWLWWVRHEEESSGRVHAALPFSRERSSSCMLLVRAGKGTWMTMEHN